MTCAKPTDGPFFVHRAYEKDLKPKAKQGLLFEASIKPNGVFGADYFTKVMKIVADKCGFVQAMSDVRSEFPRRLDLRLQRTPAHDSRHRSASKRTVPN